MIGDYSEQGLLDALRRKDRAAYRCLFDLYFEKMVLFAEYFLLDRQESEDMVQEFFLALWNRKEIALVQPSSLKSYLFTQVRNRCLNRLKHLNIEDKHMQWLREAQQYAEIPDVEIDERLVAQIYEAIEELPQQARVIFRRCVIDGRKYREVAEEMGISVNTVNTQMKRAYKYLRTKLGVAFLFFLLSV